MLLFANIKSPTSTTVPKKLVLLESVTAKKSPWSKAILLEPVNTGLFVIALYPPLNIPTPAAIDCTCAKLTPSVPAVPVATSNSLNPPKSTSASASPN